MTHRQSRTAGVIGCVALAAAAGLAAGQQKSGEPLDVNAVQPGRAPAIDLAPSPGRPATPATPATQAAPSDGKTYQVSRFVVEYHSEQEEHPPIADVLKAPVTLGVVPGGYVAPRPGVPSVTVRVGDVVEGFGGGFSTSALNEVAKAIVAEMNRRGLAGVFVQAHPEDIDEITGEDLRQGKRSELRMVIWTGVVQGVRTVASGERFGTWDPETKRYIVHDPVNRENPSHARIREQSPVKPGQLARKQDVDNYLDRLNRHPGRHVDAVFGPTDKPEGLGLDYLVTEDRPWSLFGQISNTGTKQTNEWRERVGFAHYQLTDHDDILRLEYDTASFSESHTFSASYDFPIISDKLRVKAYGLYSSFDASEVGVADETFSGRTWQVGTEARYNLAQFRQLFIDAVGGVRWENVRVENTLFDEQGETHFVIPYAGLRADRHTAWANTAAGIQFEFNLPELAGTDEGEVTRLGRIEADADWAAIKWDAAESFYLEPLLNPSGGPNGPQSLAHEISLWVRGQNTLGNQRLIPNEEDVIGGLYTVRGYPESAAAGDSVVVSSAEYRLHIPALFPVSQPGHIGGREYGLFGQDFRWAPQQPFGSADWDFIAKAFIDAGRAIVNDKVAGESDNTLVGAGVGFEVRYKRNASLRLDWGMALQPVEEPGRTTVDRGDSRFHFSLTFQY